MSKYFHYHTRICRPTGLSKDDCARVCAFASERIGFDYDPKNIFDLMRYLFPMPVPARFRRRMIALGSGDPTRIICSALIAQGIRFGALSLTSEAMRREILEIRHSRCMRRVISTFLRISRWSSRHCRTVSTTRRCNGRTRSAWSRRRWTSSTSRWCPQPPLASIRQRLLRRLLIDFCRSRTCSGQPGLYLYSMQGLCRQKPGCQSGEE